MSRSLAPLFRRLRLLVFRRKANGTGQPRIEIPGLAMLIVLGSWAYERSHTIFISDARIASDLVAVSSSTSGWISSLPVRSGNQVEAGSLLIQLDDRDIKLELQKIDSLIEAKEAEVSRAFAERDMVLGERSSQLAIEEARLELAKSEAKKSDSALKLASSSLERSQQLLASQLLPRLQWEEDQFRYTQALEDQKQADSELSYQKAKVRQAKAQMIAVELLERNISIVKEDLKRLKIERRQLLQELDDHQIRSPIDGVIDGTFAHSGEYTSAGRRLIVLHDPENIWIDAMIKETELRHIRRGMVADAEVDAYPGLSFKATLSEIAHATNSEFALLPDPSPSGSFTKVTQRLRLRLSIKQEQQLLRPGMMVQLKIDTRQQ